MGQKAIEPRAPRRRIFKDGVIQANGVGMACTVKNMSDTGALVVAHSTDFIEQLTLVVVSENLVRKCKVVWRDGTKMGVVFV